MQPQAVRRSTVRRVHLAASTGALLIVLSFLGATIAVETVGTEPDVAAVKHWIARALVVFVPVVAVAGITGRRLAGRSRGPIVSRKLRRMQLIAGTGILVLLPSALTLDHLAGEGRFDTAFVVVQTLELLAGASNVTLLALNFRDGMRMRAQRARGRRVAAQRAGAAL
jgi:hypothetical protein